MDKSFLSVLSLALTIGFPSICAASVPTRVPEPATAILLLGAAATTAAIAGVRRRK